MVGGVAPVEAHRHRVAQLRALLEAQQLGVEAVRRLDVSDVEHEMVDARSGGRLGGHIDPPTSPSRSVSGTRRSLPPGPRHFTPVQPPLGWFSRRETEEETADQTRSGVSGVSRWWMPRCPRASTTALYTAGIEPIVPDSPMPLAPSSLANVGVSMRTSSNDGSSAAEMTG